MGIRDLIFNIVGRDESGDAFDSVDRRLRRTEGATRSLQERLQTTGRAMRNFGAGMSAVSVGLVAPFRDSIALFDRQAKAQAAVVQALETTGGAAGFTADELFRAASEMQAITRFGDEAILEGVTQQLLTFGNIAGEEFLRAQVASLDLATVLGKDLQSTAIQLGKALDDPVRGVSALAESGVTFTEVQREQIKAMVEVGDVLGAQGLILDEIESKYGGQAEAARVAGAGVVDAFRNSFGDLKEIVGGTVLEFMTPLVESLESLVRTFRDLDPDTQRFIVKMGLLGAAAGPIVATLGLLALAVGALLTPVGLAITAFTVITAGVVLFWGEIKNAVDWVGEKFGEALDFGAGKLESWWSRATEIFFAIPGVMQEVAAAVREAIADGIAVQLDLARFAFESLPEPLQELLTKVTEVFTAIPRMIGEAVTAIGTALIDRLGAIFDAVGEKIEWIEGKFEWLWDRVVGNSWVPDMVDAIGANFGRLQGEMVDPTEAATAQVDAAFGGLAGSVGGKLGEMAAAGELSLRGLFDATAQAAFRWRDQLLGDVFEPLREGLDTFFGGLSENGGVFGTLLGGFGKSVLGGLLGNIPGFASGGKFGGGLAVVGERGPELVATGPARIFDAETTADFFRPRNLDPAPQQVRGGDVNITIQIDGAAGDDAIARAVEDGLARAQQQLAAFSRDVLPRRVQQIGRSPRRVGV